MQKYVKISLNERQCSKYESWNVYIKVVRLLQAWQSWQVVCQYKRASFRWDQGLGFHFRKVAYKSSNAEQKLTRANLRRESFFEIARPSSFFSNSSSSFPLPARSVLFRFLRLPSRSRKRLVLLELPFCRIVVPCNVISK